MKDLEKYWVGICPAEETEAYVDVFKKELKKEIGWFSSLNSKAHISFYEFYNDDNKLVAMEEYLLRFCSNIRPFKVILDGIGRFGRAYCIFPEKLSRKNLVDLMQQFHKGKPFDKEEVFDKPHISIGRGLTEEKVAVADKLFLAKIIQHEFLCDNIAIRKLNLQIKQYEIYKRFKLKSANDLLLI